MKHAKNVILWSTPRTFFWRSTPCTRFYEARQARQFFEACHFKKHAQHANFLKHPKYAISKSTPSTGARKAVKHAKHASTPFSRLTWSGLSVKFLMLGKTNFMVAYLAWPKVIQFSWGSRGCCEPPAGPWQRPGGD